MESVVKEKDVQNVAKSFHMTLTQLDKNFVITSRHVGQLPLKQRQAQVSNVFKKANIMDNGSTD